RRALRGDRRLVRDAGEGRALSRQPIPEGPRRIGGLKWRAVRADAGFAGAAQLARRPLRRGVRAMSTPAADKREGNLAAPTRHPVEWRDSGFYDGDAFLKEAERIFDICHGCRRCVSLCNAFPTLFDLVDGSKTMEVDGVAKADFWKVVDQCYLCDICYMTKCPYVPPHPWNVDFPHTMLRGKAIQFKRGETGFRDKLLTSTDKVGKLATIPVVVKAVNWASNNGAARALMEKTLGVAAEAALPPYAERRFRDEARPSVRWPVRDGQRTRGKVALFTTCYVNYNEPGIARDLVKVLAHNEVPYVLAAQEACCGMPKLELGDLATVEKLKDVNIPPLAALAREGFAILT